MPGKNLLAVLAALLLIVAACGDDDDDASSTATTVTEAATTTTTTGDEGGGASVSVVLSDPFGPAGTPGQFAVEPDPSSAAAGQVEFVAKNEGGDLHELVIVKGDDPASLPVDEDGVVIEEELPEGDFVGEIALVDPGTEESASFELDAGNYILFCNILPQIGTGDSHFQEGMVNTLTVT